VDLGVHGAAKQLSTRFPPPAAIPAPQLAEEIAGPLVGLKQRFDSLSERRVSSTGLFEVEAELLRVPFCNASAKIVSALGL
jgi:hypothetical protein